MKKIKISFLFIPIFCFFVFSSLLSGAEKYKRKEIANSLNLHPAYQSYESYAKDIRRKKGKIISKEMVAINNDYQNDYIIYYNTPQKKVFLDILISKNRRFERLPIPVADYYDYKPETQRVILGYHTYPPRSLRGSDLLLWYDFYKIDENSLKAINSEHIPFYQNMLNQYNTRIYELIKEHTENKKILGKKSDIVLEVSNKLKRDHIQRYRQFIKRIKLISNQKN